MLSARVKILGENAGGARFGLNIQMVFPARLCDRRTGVRVGSVATDLQRDDHVAGSRGTFASASPYQHGESPPKVRVHVCLGTEEFTFATG